VAVLGRDDPGAWSLRSKIRGRLLSVGLSDLPAGQDGVFLKHERILLRDGGMETEIFPRDAIMLRGQHNLLNAMAAVTIAAAAGLPVSAMQAGVEGFTGVQHRLEFVRRWGGAAWYNDSIATAPERVMAAIRAFDEPLVLLVGGRDKDLPWEAFAELAVQRVDHLVMFGEAAGKIEKAIQQAQRQAPGSSLTLTRCDGLHQSVQVAARLVQAGDIVLLSPGGTSFDEFKDFEERGECFVAWVNELT
jgi:UDP-N-acetylmuramoylalanine--D-glutamate ligase